MQATKRGPYNHETFKVHTVGVGGGAGGGGGLIHEYCAVKPVLWTEPSLWNRTRISDPEEVTSLGVELPLNSPRELDVPLPSTAKFAITARHNR